MYTDSGLTLFSPSAIMDLIFSRSWLRQLYLGVPFAHSSIPYITTLNLKSSCTATSGLVALVFSFQWTVAVDY